MHLVPTNQYAFSSVNETPVSQNSNQNYQPLITIPTSYPQSLYYRNPYFPIPGMNIDPSKFLSLFQFFQRIKPESFPPNATQSASSPSDSPSPNYSTASNPHLIPNNAINPQQIASLLSSMPATQQPGLHSGNSGHPSPTNELPTFDPMMVATMLQMFGSNPLLLAGLMTATNNSAQVMANMHAQNNNNNQLLPAANALIPQQGVERKQSLPEESNTRSCSFSNRVSEGALDLSRSPHATSVSPPNFQRGHGPNLAMTNITSPADYNHSESHRIQGSNASIPNAYGEEPPELVKTFSATQAQLRQYYQQHQLQLLKSTRAIEESKIPNGSKNYWQVGGDANMMMTSENEYGKVEEKGVSYEMKFANSFTNSLSPSEEKSGGNKRGNKTKHTGNLSY